MFTDLLTPLIGSDWASLIATIIWIAIAIIFIIVAWKLYLAFAGGINLLGGRGRDVRLAIIDAAPVDQKRRIVLVRRDGVEHLLMIGGPNDIVIEQGISEPVKPAIQTATQAPAQKAKVAQAKPAKAAAPAAAAAAPVAASTPLDDTLLDDIPLEDMPLAEEDMFDSLIADRVAAAKKQQGVADIPPAPVPAPKPAPAPKAAPAPAAPKPAPAQPVAQQPAVKPAAQPIAQPAAQSAAKPAAKTASTDVSLEDEMQALIRDLQTK